MLEENHVLEVLNRIFKEKLCDQTVEINLDTTADDILEWNSLKHLVIILAIENHFQIKLYLLVFETLTSTISCVRV